MSKNDDALTEVDTAELDSIDGGLMPSGVGGIPGTPGAVPGVIILNPYWPTFPTLGGIFG